MLFRRLAVFAGGCSLDAAAAVAAPIINGADPEAAGTGLDVLDGVISLTQQSLLQPREDPQGEPHYLALETIREYGLEQLAASGEADATRRAHAQFFLSFVDRTAADATGTAWEDRLEAEHDNLRAALAWSIEHDTETALRLASGLWRFWDRRSHWSEGRAWLQRALAGDAKAPPPDRASVLAGLAVLATHQADFALARRCYEECRAIWEDLGDGQGVVRALRGLGIVASNQNQLDHARALFEQALAAARTHDDRRDITLILGDLGLVAHRNGDNEAAAVYLEESLAGDPAVDEWTMAVHRGNLGLAYWGLGDRARAAVLFEEVLTTSRRLGDKYGAAINQHNLADYALGRGRLGEAAERYRESVTIAHALGEVRLANRTLDGLAAVAVSSRQPDLAARLYGAAAALRQAAGDALDASEEANRLPALTATRERLGETVWAAAWAAGQALSLEEAIAEAAAIVPPLTAGDRRAATADALLTSREAEVLRLLVEGRSDREIAEALFVTCATASKHVSNILAKLEVDSRGAAAAVALRDRLI